MFRSAKLSAVGSRVEVLGWVLVVLGVVALLIGILGGAKKLLVEGNRAEGLTPSAFKLLLEIIKQGGFGALLAVGLILLVIGLGLLGVEVFSGAASSTAAP